MCPARDRIACHSEIHTHHPTKNQSHPNSLPFKPFYVTLHFEKLYRVASFRSLPATQQYNITLSHTVSASFRHILALSYIDGVGPSIIRHLVDLCGSAEKALCADPDDFRDAPAPLRNLATTIAAQRLDALTFADKHIALAQRYGIRTLTPDDPGYPRRLAACPDAPLTLFVKGHVNLDNAKILSVVGTRRPSEEGRILTQRLVADLCRRHPDLIIVSGLAFGIDVTAHRAAILAGRPTVGVVAHGLDTLYPSQHRDVAAQMVHQGGALISEFPFETKPDTYNFVSRNRIIAGLADATLIVESALKGGSLITTRYAFDYDRQVLAVPGFPGRELSAGCNDLIRRNVAALVETPDDIDAALSWDLPAAVRRHHDAQQSTPSLFSEPQGAEQLAIVQALKAEDGLSAGSICRRTNLNIATVNTELLNMEFAGLIKSLPGNSYRLLI